jgi:hypothetical protein
MTYLNHSAANLYLGVCRESLFLGLIGYDIFLARMCALREMCRPEDYHWKYADHLLRVEQWGEERRWDAEIMHGSESLRGDGDQNETRVIWLDHDRDDDEPIILQLIPAHATGLSAWEFHKGDADPFPSIPHAHQRSNDKRKLDAFLGFIYLRGTPDGREQRESIARLWNDKKFRIFAEEAIRHFFQQNPHWQWRVRNPFRLPRIRG